MKTFLLEQWPPPIGFGPFGVQIEIEPTEPNRVCRTLFGSGRVYELGLSNLVIGDEQRAIS